MVLSSLISAPKKVANEDFSITLGLPTYLESVIILTNSANTIDIPIAEIRGANLFAPLFRNLRYATNSKSIEIIPDKNMDPSKAQIRINTRRKPVAGSDCCVKLKISLITIIAANVPNMKISELAKLIILRTP